MSILLEPVYLKKVDFDVFLPDRGYDFYPPELFCGGVTYWIF